MSAEPTVAVSTHREKRVDMKWLADEAPRLEVPYSGKTAALLAVRITQEQGREPRVSNARGAYLKKDGTPGERDAHFHFYNLKDLPEGIHDAALAALKGVAW